jgi:hypothetical protein
MRHHLTPPAMRSRSTSDGLLEIHSLPAGLFLCSIDHVTRSAIITANEPIFIWTLALSVALTKMPNADDDFLEFQFGPDVAIRKFEPNKN